ncbi:hypothetical protein M409DRAFT_57673 [Zasmidium cellare ATCC 36951]|uniref:Uncharacterized protein n=1 Tax=Zasmidium cellare ATCC 36951 TaxID=1080233 RepID=A0A6A6CCI5_ZASCE|nr:uncharacterized protein M409DRAFT_57673 [Zasmidium cellare ATCC 36951]KAF2163399.1 hypothetical protein M409DRAFT_57673 [Zasmidium cellare ATCC 36951]
MHDSNLARSTKPQLAHAPILAIASSCASRSDSCASLLSRACEEKSTSPVTSNLPGSRVFPGQTEVVTSSERSSSSQVKAFPRTSYKMLRTGACVRMNGKNRDDFGIEAESRKCALGSAAAGSLGMKRRPPRSVGRLVTHLIHISAYARLSAGHIRHGLFDRKHVQGGRWPRRDGFLGGRGIDDTRFDGICDRVGGIADSSGPQEPARLRQATSQATHWQFGQTRGEAKAAREGVKHEKSVKRRAEGVGVSSQTRKVLQSPSPPGEVDGELESLMAERACHPGTTRRQSFRKTLVDAGLPQEYLDALEQKRRQLDESIHKYIAAKEREYKQYEKELRQQYKLAQDKEIVKPRRTSWESTQDIAGSPRLQGQQQSVVDVLLAAGLKRDQIGHSVAVAVVDDDGTPTLEAKSSMAGMTDRRASIERDKEFVGVFTPAFLPALENKAQSTNAAAERGSSAPPPSSAGIEQGSDQDRVHRAHSDSVVQAQGKRPAHLQLVERTSSSGSSADGKLTSALKSPTHASRQPKRKRVSIAVGNSIVAPSDNVPVDLSSNNHTPSHSRTRSPASERDSGPTSAARAVDSLKDAQKQAESTAILPETSQPLTNGKFPVEKAPSPITTPSAQPSPPPPARASQIDADGDLFDLDDEDDEPSAKPEPIPDDPLSSEDDITGRVSRNPHFLDDGDIYDPNAGIISEPEEPEDNHDHADHIEFMPGSANASQQPTNPGFRRPSVSIDPVYAGENYARAEHSAIVNEVYGSSYVRPASKGSFTAGSLGESFMARNAEMLRNRAPQDESQVRS